MHSLSCPSAPLHAGSLPSSWGAAGSFPNLELLSIKFESSLTGEAAALNLQDRQGSASSVGVGCVVSGVLPLSFGTTEDAFPALETLDVSNNPLLHGESRGSLQQHSCRL